MKVVAVIQARLGSTRLPGKVMYPLGSTTVLSQIIKRTETATEIDEVVVATSSLEHDALLDEEGRRRGIRVERGSESDVMKRMYDAASAADADIIVRLCGDNPLLSPACIDAVVERLRDSTADYVSNNIERTFPVGLDTEAFTMSSFESIEATAEKPVHREHVTTYYKQNRSDFETVNVTSEAVFDTPTLHDRTELRLTLDEVDDYRLLREIYENVESDGETIALERAVQYIDTNGLAEMSAHLTQRTPTAEDG